MCRDFKDERFPESFEEIDYSSHGGHVQQLVESLPPQILDADLRDLQDTRGLPRVGEETYQRMLAIMGIVSHENDDLPTTEVA
jgi:hypothetical protein